MIASLLGILGGFILLMLGVIVGIHSVHMTVGLLMMFGGLVSMLYYLPHYKENRHE
jgi:heme/copper-type cytochrome/quinol oxidase subunit 3